MQENLHYKAVLIKAAIEAANEAESKRIRNNDERIFLSVEGLQGSYSDVEKLNIVLVKKDAIGYHDLFDLFTRKCEEYKRDPYLIHKAINTDLKEWTHIIFEESVNGFSFGCTIKEFIRDYNFSNSVLDHSSIKTLINDYKVFIEDETSRKIMAGEEIDITPIREVLIIG